VWLQQLRQFNCEGSLLFRKTSSQGEHKLEAIARGKQATCSEETSTKYTLEAEKGQYNPRPCHKRIMGVRLVTAWFLIVVAEVSNSEKIEATGS